MAKVVYVYLIPGILTRVPDGWCDTCQVSSIWEAPVWRLSDSGISLDHHVRGCAECDTWTRA